MCFENFRKIHGKTSVSKCLFNKDAGLHLPTLLKRDSDKSVFLHNLQSFKDHLFCTTPPDDSFFSSVGNVVKGAPTLQPKLLCPPQK